MREYLGLHRLFSHSAGEHCEEEADYPITLGDLHEVPAYPAAKLDWSQFGGPVADDEFLD